MRDMTPPGDRSIRNIPIPKGHKLIRPEEPRQEIPQTDEPLYEEDYIAPQKRKKPMRRFIGSRLFWILVGVVVICLAIGLLMSTLFAGASVTVTPRSATVAAPDTLQAQINAPAGTLAYQVVTSSRTASTTVTTSGTEQVSLSASGVATIYNAYNTSSQDLVATTRFEAPDGKIYRIHSNITVPGAVKASDGSLTPGSITATIYADKPGADYNRSATTQFTIPGFKGDAKYTKFYAKAASISGGLVGTQPAVSKTDLATAQQSLKQGLSNAMNDMMQTQIPKEFIAIPGTLSVTYNDIVQTPVDGNKAVLSQTANASASVINVQDLATAIARQTVQGYAGEAVTIADQSQLSLALATTSATGGPITLKLSGNPKLVWQFDPNALKQAIVGKPKSEFETILKSFAPAITCSNDTPCKASIRPFWSSSFPSNPDKISIVSKK